MAKTCMYHRFVKCRQYRLHGSKRKDLTALRQAIFLAALFIQNEHLLVSQLHAFIFLFCTVCRPDPELRAHRLTRQPNLEPRGGW